MSLLCYVFLQSFESPDICGRFWWFFSWNVFNTISGNDNIECLIHLSNYLISLNCLQNDERERYKEYLVLAQIKKQRGEICKELGKQKGRSMQHKLAYIDHSLNGKQSDLLLKAKQNQYFFPNTQMTIIRNGKRNLIYHDAINTLLDYYSSDISTYLCCRKLV